MTTTKRGYDFFRAQGLGAQYALKLAKAEIEAVALGWVCHLEAENEPWDGDSPAPKYLFCAILYDADNNVLSSLGMIGVNDLRDPCLRVEEAELCLHALSEMRVQEARAKARDRALNGNASVTCA